MVHSLLFRTIVLLVALLLQISQASPLLADPAERPGSEGRAEQEKEEGRGTLPFSLVSPPNRTVEATAIRTPVEIGTATVKPLKGKKVGMRVAIANDSPADFPLGTTTVVWSATAPHKQTITAEQKVTVVDTISPTLSPPSDIVLEVETVLPVAINLGMPTASDIFPLTITSNAPFAFPLGTTLVTWSATDSSGNRSTAVQRVTLILVDRTPPVVVAPADLTIEATGPLTLANIGMATANDAIDGALPVLSDAPLSFPPGTTLVRWSAIDASGNIGFATQQVTVIDSTPPQISAPADLTVEASGPATPIDVGMASASDIVDPDPVIRNDAPPSFPVGITTIIWRAIDGSGNVGTASQRIEVRDTTAPDLRLLGGNSLIIDEGQTWLDPGAVADDRVDGNLTSAVSVSGSVDSARPGSYVVVYTVADAHGNSASVERQVTVRDVTAPVVTPPAHLIVEASAPMTLVLDLGAASAVDAVDGPVAVVGDSPGLFPLGITVVRWSAVDAAGNRSVAEQMVELRDTTAPTLNVPADLELISHDHAPVVAQLGTATAFDTVDGAIVATHDAPAAFPVGVTDVLWSAVDAAGNRATATQRVIVRFVDIVAPIVTPPTDIVTEATGPFTIIDLGIGSAMDETDGAMPVYHNGPAAGFPVGASEVTWSAFDLSGNLGTAVQRVQIQDRAAPSLSVPGDIELTTDNGLPVAVDLGIATANDLVDGQIPVQCDAPLLFPVGVTTVTCWATDNAGNNSLATRQITVRYLPPAPTAATALLRGGFGANYRQFVPADASLAAYDERRFTLLTGFVEDMAGTPFSGATVRIHDHPEYGSAVSDASGRYAIPVDGGGELTVEISAPGHLQVQRKKETGWNRIDMVETVALTRVDERGTTVILNGNPDTFTVHHSTPQTDGDGTRAAHLVFSGDTAISVVHADGSSSALLVPPVVRASEFTRPKAMPAPLPPTTAFTYCSDLTLDGLEAGDSVRFSRPVTMYVDNFLRFPVGEVVPVGYYDRAKALWIPSDNGRVVRLLDLNGDGRVDALDATGDGLPDDLDGDGAMADEVAGLGSDASMLPGSSYWRVEIRHFTPFDLNWTWDIPNESGYRPGPPPPTVDDQKCGECKSHTGSSVSNESRIFSEEIALAGSGMTLNYSADRTRGYGRTIEIPISGDQLPASLAAIHTQVAIGGRAWSFTSAPVVNQQVRVDWDGTDFTGRRMEGAVNAAIAITYDYPIYYRGSTSGSSAFGQIGRSGMVLGARVENIFAGFTQEKTQNLHLPPDGQIASGWNITAVGQSAGHEAFDGLGDRVGVAGARLWRGIESLPVVDAILATADTGGTPQAMAVADDGSIYFSRGDWQSDALYKFDPRSGTVDLVIGGGWEAPGDGVLAINSYMDLGAVEVAPDGGIYVLDANNQAIWKIGRDGRMKHIAGNYWFGSYDDGIPATMAKIGDSQDIALGPDGSLYVTDAGYYHSRILRIAPDGLIYRFAGTGAFGSSGDGGPALQATLEYPGGIDVAVDGSVYFTEWHSGKVRRIDATGRISTVAGNGGWLGAEVGVPATQVPILFPNDVTVGKDGRVYVGEMWMRLLRIEPNGILSLVAGTAYPWELSPEQAAVSFVFNGIRAIAMDADGDILVADESRILRISERNNALTSFSAEGLAAYPDRDRDRMLLFDPYGQHVRTLDLDSMRPLLEIGYDTSGHPVSLRNRFGDTTRIDYSGDAPYAIVAPDGQTTMLDISGDRLLGVTYPDGSGYRFTYSPQGLLTGKSNPNGGLFAYSYDSMGRIAETQDAAGGRTQFTSRFAGGGISAIVTDPMGRSSYSRRVEAGGASEVLFTDAAGLSTRRLSADQANERLISPDGSIATTRFASDPRYHSRRVAGSELLLPSGLNSVSSSTIAYADNDGDGIPDLIDRSTTANGQTSTRSDDLRAGVRTLTTPAGRIASEFYDPATLLVTAREVAGLARQSFAYDLRGRLISTTVGTGADARTTTLAYDAAGNLASIVDPANRTTRFGYDPMGRRIWQRQPDGRTIEYGYDRNGNLTSLTPPGRFPHRFDYTPVDLASGYTPPQAAGSGATLWAYNAAKQPTLATRSDGQSIHFDYDAAGRLSASRHPGGAIRYSYDPATGQLAGIDSGDAALSYAWDGPLPVAESWSGAANGTVAVAYDADFRIVSRTVGTTRIDYGYDADGLPIQAGALAIGRDAQSGLPTSTLLGGVATSSTFSPFGEEASFYALAPAGALYAADYGRDRLGRIVDKVETVGGATTHIRYAYDAAGHLSAVSRDGVAQALYIYDDNGNRIGGFDGHGAIDATFDAQDRLLAWGANRYSYGAGGELRGKSNGSGNTQYSYDLLGNLRQAILPDGRRIDYAIDGMNRRIGKLIDGQPVQGFLYEDALRPAAELDGSGSVVARFVYGSKGNVPDYMLKGGVAYRIISDQLGSPRLVVDAAGAIVQRIDYDEWGNITQDTNPGFQPFGFAGGLYDRDTGLTRFGARDYDPETGRWTNKDPILFQGGDSNLYGYVLGDPVNGVDPSGLIKLPADPFGLPEGWELDPSHQDPNGERWRSGDDYLDFHRGRPNETGWRKRDHWHHNGEKRHLRPGEDCPIAGEEGDGSESAPANLVPTPPWWSPIVLIPVLISP